jgi:phosphopantetheinyl transferase
MFPVTELIMQLLTPSLDQCLELAEAPLLRKVELAVLQAEVASDRLDPAGFLTPAEQATFSGFSFPKRRLDWLGGRLAAKAAALAWAGQPVTAAGLAEWQVTSAPDGRPGLQRVGTPAAPAPELSISHSHGIAAALVMTERPCGLDLQKVTDTVLRVRERFCSASEAALLRAGGVETEAREAVRLTLLWAAKEALRKERGGVPLTGFLAMRLTGLARLGEQGWCFRLAVAGAGEYPVVVFLMADLAGAVSVR